MSEPDPPPPFPGADASPPAAVAIAPPYAAAPFPVMPEVAFQKALLALTPKVYVAYALIAVNALIFVAMVVSGVGLMSPESESLISWGANYGPRTTGGEWWRLFTCMFLHAGIIHVGMNMLVLHNIGPFVERLTGNAGFLEWFWLPLLPLFVIYFISGVAETNRAPFDVVEGESEIVAGHMVEYSGSQFALFFLAEYANMILVSFLTSIFFLGGWLSPFHGWGIPLLSVDGWWWLLAKVFFFASCFIWFRASFPRYRYDQIMRLGWKVFIPITIAWIFVTALLVYFGVIQAGQ